MNTIGIDYQQTLSVVCLGEGRGASVQVRTVGDGLRPLIPNAVQGEDLWGSRALSAGGKIPADPEDGPWLTEPDAPQFWNCLYRRMVAFLGRIAPTSQNGYRVVVGLQAANYPAAVAGMERLCDRAGFGLPTCIPAPDALLARWLAEQRYKIGGESILTVVVAGDTSTMVSSYRFQYAAGSVPRLVARDSNANHLPFGQAHWTGRLLINVNDLFTEPVRSGYELAMRDAALEFGARLRRAPAGRTLSWNGPFRDKLYKPLELTPEECRAWPEAAPILQRLPGMIRESAQSVGGKGRPDVILVGGIGALWPFAAEAAATVGTVAQSENPEEDVARGAAWWPEVESLWGDTPVALGAAVSAALPDWLVDTPDVAASALPDLDSPFFSMQETTSIAFRFDTDTTEQTPAAASLFGEAVHTESLDFTGDTADLLEKLKGIGPINTPFSTPEPTTSVSITPDFPTLPGGLDINNGTLQNIGVIPPLPGGLDYDILPKERPLTKESAATDKTEDEDLDTLPPWDPRRKDA